MLFLPRKCVPLTLRGGGGHSSPPFDPPLDIIESSISMKIEILMFSIRNVFLTLRTDNQADNSFFQDSSLREREYIYALFSSFQDFFFRDLLGFIQKSLCV